MRTDAILRSSLAADEIKSQLSELSLRVILPTGVTSIGEMGAAQGGAAAAAPQPISFALSSWVNNGEADLLVWSGVDFDATLPDDQEPDEDEWNTCEEWVRQAVRDLKKTGAGGLTLTDGADGVEKVMIKASPHYKSYRELCGLRRVKAGANVAANEAWRCATNGIVLGIDRTSSFGILAVLLSCFGMKDVHYSFRELGVAAPAMVPPAGGGQGSKRKVEPVCTDDMRHAFIASLDKRNLLPKLSKDDVSPSYP